MSRTMVAAVTLLALSACSPASDEHTSGVPADEAAPEPTETAARPAPPLELNPTDRSQLVYVPVYSHIYHQDEGEWINLAATLSIRNTDPAHPITITAIRYYDSEGRLVRGYLREPVRLGPLASIEVVVAEEDETGGAGANFLVEWRATESVTDPVIEAVMISTQSTLGISFTSRGRALERR